jgi:hypothetical protein
MMGWEGRFLDGLLVIFIIDIFFVLFPVFAAKLVIIISDIP